MPLGRRNIDRLTSIHSQAADVQRLVLNCLTANKIGRDWRMDMMRAGDRIRDFAEQLAKDPE